MSMLAMNYESSKNLLFTNVYAQLIWLKNICFGLIFDMSNLLPPIFLGFWQGISMQSQVWREKGW